MANEPHDAELIPAPPGPSVPPAYTERDLHLDAETVERLVAASPANTRRAYTWAVGKFAAWCGRRGRVSLPATPQTLAVYTSHLMSEGHLPAGLEHAIGAIRAWHRRNGHPGQPDTTGALDVLRLARRVEAEAGRSQRQAVPFTKATLHQCIDVLDLDSPVGRRDQVVLVFGFLMMARRSELARLRFGDITETPDGLDVLVRASKTDKQSAGRLVSLPPQSHPHGDPVRVLRAWRAQRDDDGTLLCRFSRARTPRPLGPLSGGGVNEVVRATARRAHLEHAERYTAHSLRAGGLTDALKRGEPIGIAARHGGWDPESPVPARYARAADRWKDNAMRGAL